MNEILIERIGRKEMRIIVYLADQNDLDALKEAAKTLAREVLRYESDLSRRPNWKF